MASIARGRSRRREGVVSTRKQATYPGNGIISDSVLAAMNGQSKSRKASVVPMKMLIDEEFSNDINARHISPGAVGRLMGLDSLPSSEIHSQHKYTQSHTPKTSPGSFHDQNGLHEDIPHRRSADDTIDVFEVMETTKTKMRRSPRSKHGNTTSRPDKFDCADMDFIREKFMDAKRLSTDESLHISEEFNETLDALVSNRDLLLEFLQKFDPVVKRDLRNHGSLSSTANCITILKPSRRNQYTGVDNIYLAEKGTESNFNDQKEVKHSLSKPCSNASFHQALNEECGSLRQKLSMSGHQENTGKRGCPTRIVVLKPSLEKPHDIEGALPLHHIIPHSDYRRHKEHQDVGRWSLYTEDYTCQVPLGDSETSGRMGKGSREIAREITKQLRVARAGSRKQVKPETRTSASDEGSLFLPSITKFKTPEAIHRSSELCDAWASSSFNSSPTYSTETSVSKEAKKHLSNRWKKTHQCQHQLTDNDGFSTLGDMLALSDQDASKVASNKMACGKHTKGEVQSDRVQGSCIYPLGISSNDGWRDTTSSKLIRSKSLPSSFIRGVQKSNNRKRNGSVRYNEFSMLKDVLKVGPHYSEYASRSRQRQSLSRDSTIHGDESLSSDVFPDNEERMAVERDIHVNYEEPVNVSAVPDTSEQSLPLANPDPELDAVGIWDTSSTIPGNNQKPLSSTGHNQQMLNQTSTALDNCLLVPNHDDLVTKDERTECYQADDYPAIYDPQIGLDSQGDDNQTLCVPPNVSESPTSSNTDDQQSPVSVLESSMDAEDVYSGDFEKISADLQDLRMQLRLLKETTDPGYDSEFFIPSDDETARQPLPEVEEFHAFRDMEERDFCYVFDMLTGLGIDARSKDELLDNCYLLEYPAGLDLYDELEKKYSSLILWPQHERKLLFDITSAVLRDIITSVMNSCSKGLMKQCSHRWDQDDFSEMVWQRVVQLRQGMELDELDEESLLSSMEWVGSEDGTYLVGSDIGGMLQEDIIEEIIADFVGVSKSAKLRG
ncbi:hypothetical protein BS78_01G397200 [Paspalum vaginatum]|nr:hypothetical protein BS78_01G397200 [Paspalum vaginatum]